MSASVLQAVLEENQALRSDMEVMKESMNEFSERVAEVKWTLVGTGSDTWDLTAVKQVSDPLTDLVHSNPLLSRAVALRHAYTYGDGVKIDNVARAQKPLADQGNQDAFFGTQAAMARLSERASAGNLFYLVNPKTRQIIHVPMSQISGVITDNMDTSRVLFVRRRWNKTNNEMEEKWFRAHTNPKKASSLPRSASGNHELNGSWVMVHRAYNRIAGVALGVPDALAVMKWAEAYTEYLTNQSRLVRAYSRIAGRVVNRTSNTNKEVAAEMARAKSDGTYGHTVVGEFQHLPATGSQVSFDNGRAMAALVAAGLGVGVDALLSGTVGATKSVSDMLDLATSAIMRTLQRDEAELYRIILDLLGAPNADVDFPTFDHDPLYRRMASLTQATAQGLLFRSEARKIVLDWMNVIDSEKGLPEPDGFNIGTDEPDGEDPTPAQGKSGAVGSQVGSNNDARDNGEYDE